jgi:hypothetical protein
VFWQGCGVHPLRFAWTVALFLFVGKGAEAANADQIPAAAAAKPFAWIVGRWRVSPDNLPSLSWSDPDPHRRPAKRRTSEPAAESWVELIVTEEGDVLNGALDALTPNGKRKILATFAIDRGKADCPLTWREGGARYQSPMEGSGYAYRVEPGDVARSDQKRYVRFTKMRSRSRRSPFPIVIEFSDYSGTFMLRRVQGPQHGAAIDQIFRFQRWL